MTAPNTHDTSDLDAMDPMERTIQSTLRESVDEIAADVPITGRPRDNTGKFVSLAEGAQAAQPGEWNTIPDAGSEEGMQEIIIPEGHAAIAVLAPEKVQGFKVLDAEGEILPPDLTFDISFRDGNTRTMDVPTLVNFARQGVYNHELQTQAVSTRTENMQLQQTVQQERQTREQMAQDRYRLLTDPDYLIQQIQLTEQQNTPEARAQRERESIQEQRQQLDYDRAAQSNLTYLDTQVSPALDQIVRTLPTVQKGELADYLSQLIEPYKVQTKYGVILDPRMTKHVEADIIHRLVPYAMQLHAQRNVGTPKPPAPIADPKVASLQDKLAKTKRVATSVLRPSSGNQPQGGNHSTKPPTASKDLESFIIGRSLAGSGRG